MRKFKYIKYNVWVNYLTLGKVYELVKYTKRNKHPDVIEIINDNGKKCEYLLHTRVSGEFIFKEVTTEYRNEIIDGILE